MFATGLVGFLRLQNSYQHVQKSDQNLISGNFYCTKSPALKFQGESLGNQSQSDQVEIRNFFLNENFFRWEIFFKNWINLLTSWNKIVLNFDHFLKMKKTNDPELLFLRFNARYHRRLANNCLILDSWNGLFNFWACLTVVSYYGRFCRVLSEPEVVVFSFSQTLVGCIGLNGLCNQHYGNRN